MIEFFPEFVLSKEILSIWPRRADSGQNRNNLFTIREIWERYQTFWFRFQNETFVLQFWHYYIQHINVSDSLEVAHSRLLTFNSGHTVLCKAESCFTIGIWFLWLTWCGWCAWPHREQWRWQCDSCQWGNRGRNSPLQYRPRKQCTK